MSSQTRLFVGNLPEKTTEEDLQTAFSLFGEITNLDLKIKTVDDDKRNFAFITLSSSQDIVESCIKHFTQQNFKGQRLYVTRARESFLERLQRERQQEQATKTFGQVDLQNLPIHNPIINLSEKLNPRKRKVEFHENEAIIKKVEKAKGHSKIDKIKQKPELSPVVESIQREKPKTDHKKKDADKKRTDSIKKKRQEFKDKQTMIKTSLLGIDKAQNKKIIFSDGDTPNHNSISNDVISVKPNKHVKNNTKKKALFDIDDSGDEINFDIKKQFEGRNGQKVLDLASRYKSDKRFVLDERFIDDEQVEIEDTNLEDNENEEIELGPADEKDKQLDILQDLLGVAIKRHAQEPVNNKKIKSKLGMLRFDPTHPEHAKFLAPVEEKPETAKRSKKKKKDKQEELTKSDIQPELPKPEVSKEQFYKVSDTLKEAIAQPTTFSFRSLFGNHQEDTKNDDMEEDAGFIPLVKPKDKKKVKNPLEPEEKNPFVYDSSDSEDEIKDEAVKQAPAQEKAEVKAVWKENLFFSKDDFRLKESLAFFNKTSITEVYKERRELKSLMKKRIYNKERKNQMFQKKIGGRKKIIKKNYRQKT